MLKKMISKAVGFAMVSILAAAVLPATAGRQVYAAESAGGTISVNGIGSLKVMPDVAYVSLGVETTNADAKKAQQSNSEKMDAVMKALVESGISKDNIETSSYYMFTNYDYSSAKARVITGYTISNSISVTTKDIDNVGSVIDIAVGAGANQANSVQFSISDNNAYYEKALEAAYANASAKAAALAEAMNVTVKTVVSVSESGYGNTPMVYGETAMMKGMEFDSAAGGTGIVAGGLEVRASVQVVFSY